MNSIFEHLFVGVDLGFQKEGDHYFVSMEHGHEISQ